MKILFCIGSLEKGGAERVISNLANDFVKNNEIIIVTTINKIEYALNKDIKLYSLEKEKKLNELERLKKLYKIVRNENPNIIVSFLTGSNFRILLLRKFINIPIIISVRNDPKQEYKTIKNKILMKLLYPLADAFVFQTEDAKKYFNKKIQEKSIIIPNPIKKEFLERNLYTGEKDNLIVTVGRLEKQKNHKLLIETFNEINKEIPEYKLIIYGEGSLRKQLEARIKELNLQDKILLPGVVDDVPKKIEKAKLFVMSSNYEGMPNALMEAMALGLVTISTDCPCGGPKFLIGKNERGYLVQLNNKCELANTIKSVLKADSKEIANNARNFALNLSEEKINNIWYKYIKNIANKFNKIQKRGK